MRFIVSMLAVLVALVVAAPAMSATTPISITKAGFVPKDADIKVGDTVLWTNADTVNRQVVSRQGGFTSPVLKPGETYAFTATKAGKFPYEDALVKKDKGSITVTAAPPGANAVTLGAAPKVVTFGGKVTLTGVVSNQQAGETVTINAVACGGTAQARVGTATTGTGGGYSFQVQPLKNTTYQVKWKNADSAAVAVKVRPRIRLGKVTPTRFTVRVFAADSFAGKYVTFQRFNAVLKRWANVRTALLRANTTGVAPTVISSVTLTSRVKARSRVRVVLPQAQVGGCYAPGVSSAIIT